MQALPIAGLALIALFLSLILFKKNKLRSDIFLALFFILIGAELTFRLLVVNGYTKVYNWPVLFDLVYWILLGPVVYLYAGFTIRKDRKFSRHMILHLIPLLIILVPFIHFQIILPGTGFFQYTNNHPVYRWIIDIFWEYCVLAYLIVLIIRLIRLREEIPVFFSSRKSKDLSWLLYLSLGFAANIVISMTLYYLNSYHVIALPGSSISFPVVILILYLLGVGIFGYRQDGIFSENELQEVSNSQYQGKLGPVPERVFKYRRSGLQAEESRILLNDLKRIMKTQQPYTDCELNLQGLATMLNTSVHKLSQVINEYFGQNFYDFINSYRIEEVKKLLQDAKNNNLKVLSLAYDCGFNPKSAFYSVFRKYTGMTPVEYRQKYQPECEKIYTN
jgi:AraC-like DNA-binding protein